MPAYLVPKRSGVHRFAGEQRLPQAIKTPKPSSSDIHCHQTTTALALFRALITQCTSAPAIPDDRRQALTRHIRAQFRKNRELQSPRLLARAFKAGYEAESILHSCTECNDAESRSRVLNLLDQIAPSCRLQKKTRSPPLPAAADTRKPPQPFRRPAPWPGATPVLSRPHLELSGRRHVPKLVNANGFPFLRFKKPQSPYLSRVLRDKIFHRVKIFDRMYAFEGMILQAEREDQWDNIVRDMHGVSAGPTTTIIGRRGARGGAGERTGRIGRGLDDEPSWTAELREGHKDCKSQLHRHTVEASQLAAKMQAIVDREGELAAQERIERKMAKNQARKDRKAREREEGAGAPEDLLRQ
ncbi:MAG: hypothetical protein M1819_002951 [Sarea resinae]|nr:MAG: hypothetical protein M1819_002951 [Sarea resinae]